MSGINKDNSIPVIDLSKDEDIVIHELMGAFTTIGFATLIHHGVPSDTIQRAFEASKVFFGLAQNVKLKYKFQGHDSNRGYIAFGSETHDLEAKCSPDMKETLDIGKENEEGFQNKWPTELEDTSFRRDLLNYYQTMDGLYLRLVKWIGIGLKLPDPDYLVHRCDAQHENLRLLHYPALDDTSDEVVRGNIHTDFGTLTLLAQDQVGGLKVRRKDGLWLSVKPVPDAIVVNVGDMLMRWSNDVLKATLHQVVTPPLPAKANVTVVPERYSIAFFCNANKDTLLECLAPCCQSQPPRYPPINAYEYITRRLTDTIQHDTGANE